LPDRREDPTWKSDNLLTRVGGISAAARAAALRCESRTAWAPVMGCAWWLAGARAERSAIVT